MYASGQRDWTSSRRTLFSFLWMNSTCIYVFSRQNVCVVVCVNWETCVDAGAYFLVLLLSSLHWSLIIICYPGRCFSKKSISLRAQDNSQKIISLTPSEYGIYLRSFCRLLMHCDSYAYRLCAYFDRYLSATMMKSTSCRVCCILTHWEEENWRGSPLWESTRERERERDKPMTLTLWTMCPWCWCYVIYANVFVGVDT